MRWAARARDEYRRAARTWMCTLTMSPDHHAMIDAKLAQQGQMPDRSRLSEDAYDKMLFRARAGQFGQHVSAWLDVVRRVARLRGATDGEIRYLLVTEAHKGEQNPWMRMRPHAHLLMHEAVGGFLVRGDAGSGNDNGEIVFRKHEVNGEWKNGVYVDDKAIVRSLWEWGFTKLQLCFDEKEAFYLCKYISKDMGGGRVRASLHYGETVEDASGERVNDASGAAAGELTPPSGLNGDSIHGE